MGCIQNVGEEKHSFTEFVMSSNEDKSSNLESLTLTVVYQKKCSKIMMHRGEVKKKGFKSNKANANALQNKKKK